MQSGDCPGLQNRRVASDDVTDGFDSHSLPPFAFNNLHALETQIKLKLHPELDRGSSDFDVRHRIAAHFLWEMPGPAVSHPAARYLTQAGRLTVS